jgi:hypothetical protein
MWFEAKWDYDSPAGTSPMCQDGVKDSRDGSWVVRGLSQVDARWYAAVLSARYTEAGDRADDAVSWRDPPIRAIHQLTPGRTERVLVHVWVREPDGWHGWFSYLERAPTDGGRWAPAHSLTRDG